MKFLWGPKKYTAISRSLPEGYCGLESYTPEVGLCLGESPHEQYPPSLTGSEASTEHQQLSRWAESYPELLGSKKLKYRCPLVNCKKKFRTANQMVQHMSSIHGPISACTCPAHYGVAERNVTRGLASLKRWPRSVFEMSVWKCFGFRRTTQAELCPVHHSSSSSSSSNFSSNSNPSSLDWRPELELDGTCERFEIGSSAVPQYEVESTVASEMGSSTPNRAPCELPAWESTLLLAQPTHAPRAYPLSVNTGFSVADQVHEYSPVSSLSPSDSENSPNFFLYDRSVTQTVEPGANSASQGFVTADHDVVMSDSYDHPMSALPYPVETGRHAEPDFQTGHGDPQAPYDPHLEAEDLTWLYYVEYAVNLARSELIDELVNNSVVAFNVFQDAVGQDQSSWLREYIEPFSSAPLLLQRCLQALRRVVLGSPMSADDACHELFYLRYLAVTAVPMLRGFCVQDRQRFLSEEVDPLVCLEAITDSCLRYVDLIHYSGTIHRLLGGRPSMEQPVPVSISYVKNVVVPSLLREPGIGMFEHSITNAVDCLDTQEDHDLYDVVARLICAGYCEGQPFIDYITAVVLSGHAALVDVSGLQPRKGYYVGVVDELVKAVAESTPATPQASPTPFHNDGSRKPFGVASPSGYTDSGYGDSLPATPPNTPGEVGNCASLPGPPYDIGSRYPSTPSSRPARQAVHHQYPSYPSPPTPQPTFSPALDEPPLKCRFCDYEPVFHRNRHFRESNLTRHEKHVHREKDFVYVCPACGKMVGRPDNFKTHLSKHLSEHPELGRMTPAEMKGYRRRMTQV